MKMMMIYYFRFPRIDKSPERHSVWYTNAHRVRKPSKYSLICSDHFTNDWFDRTGHTVRLKKGAVPTKFKLPKHLQVRYLNLLNICSSS
jgi:hypothetical protein